MTHIWWSGPKTEVCWKAIHCEIVTKAGIPLEFKPETCLLHMYRGLGRFEITLGNNLLVAARMLIAKNWKTQTQFPQFMNGGLSVNTAY